MQRWYKIAGLMCCVGLLCFAFGCSDDDESPTGTNNPTPIEVQYEIFSSEFGGASEATGEMIAWVFQHIEVIMNPPMSEKQLANKAAYGAEYHAESKFWVVYDTMMYDELLTVVDSIQFIEGTDTVQYFNEQDLTKVRSLMTLDLVTMDVQKRAGTAGVSAHFEHNISITTTSPVSDTIFLAGTGSAVGAAADTIMEPPDSIICDVDIQTTWTVANFSMDMSNYEGGMPCPYAGSIVYDANVDISCTGTDSGRTAGNWDVILNFDEGLMEWVYSYGTKVWYDTGSCF